MRDANILHHFLEIFFYNKHVTHQSKENTAFRKIRVNSVDNSTKFLLYEVNYCLTQDNTCYSFLEIYLLFYLTNNYNMGIVIRNVNFFCHSVSFTNK